jgi:hypothetical protein
MRSGLSANERGAGAWRVERGGKWVVCKARAKRVKWQRAAGSRGAASRAQAHKDKKHDRKSKKDKTSAGKQKTKDTRKKARDGDSDQGKKTGKKRAKREDVSSLEEEPKPPPRPEFWESARAGWRASQKSRPLGPWLWAAHLGGRPRRLPRPRPKAKPKPPSEARVAIKNSEQTLRAMPLGHSSLVLGKHV